MIAKLQSNAVYLYNKGTENEDLIGNIVASAFGFNTSSSCVKSATTITRSGNKITFTQPLTTGNNYTQGSVWFSKPIDFTDYTSLNINILDVGSSEVTILLCKSYQSINSNAINLASFKDSTTGIGAKHADISTITGSYYVAFALFGVDCKISFDELWLDTI